MPDDELPDPAGLIDDRRAGAAAPRVERAPALGARPLVERDHQRVRLAAHHGDELLAVDQGSARRAPGRHARVVLDEVVPVPDHPPGLDVEAPQQPGRPEHVDAVLVHGGRGHRPGGVRHHQRPIGRTPRVAPQLLAGLLVEGQYPLSAVQGARLGILQPVGHEDAAVSHRRTGEPVADRGPPLHLQPRGGELVDDPRLVPHAQPAGASPLAPVLGNDGRRRAGDRRDEPRAEPQPGAPQMPDPHRSRLHLPARPARQSSPGGSA